MRRAILSNLFFVFLLLLCVSHSVEAGRPLNTDDAGVVTPKTLEVEFAYEHVNSVDNENNLSLVLTTGLFDSLDVGVEIPYQFIDVNNSDNQNGVSDISLTTKWNVYSDEDLFDATLSFNYKSDNGNDEMSLGTGEREYTILAIISKEISDVAIHFNLGPTIVLNGDDVINYNIASQWSVAETLSLAGELFGSHNFQDGFDDNSLSTLFGFIYEFNEKVVCDLGFTFGISDADPDFKVTTGVTIAFGD